MFTEEEERLVQTNTVKEFGKMERNVSRNAHNSLMNRIKSIQIDIEFVERIREKVPYLPIIPNLRNGKWYVMMMANKNNMEKHASYFKSTDGHDRNWCFHSQRANLNVIHLALSEGGVIIVDSTRFGGKR